MKHDSKCFDCLAVTSVQVYPFQSTLSYMKAIAVVVLNGQFVVRGLRVMDGADGLFVGYPKDPLYIGEGFTSVCSPLTRQLKDHIENCVLERYQAAIMEEMNDDDCV